MLKKAVQQGRSERRDEEVRTALCEAVRRRMDLGEWKIPSSASGLRKTLFNVESLSEVRTKLEDFFSILLERRGSTHEDQP